MEVFQGFPDGVPRHVIITGSADEVDLAVAMVQEVGEQLRPIAAGSSLCCLCYAMCRCGCPLESPRLSLGHFCSFFLQGWLHFFCFFAL